jgi:ABC-type histidine transport system ATPase subunit
MQVRATALDDHGKILDQIVGMHERKRKQKAEVSGGQDGRFAPVAEG